jgi:membrane protein YqaA with SNARE-associated domain
MGSKVESPFALVWFFFLFLIESCVFFIPVDPLLIIFCLQENKKGYIYATIATCASVIGGLFGYMIGFLMWDAIGPKLVGLLFSQHTFSYLVAQYQLYQSWAVLIAGFTPIPYKAVTISAGFCHLPIIPFIIYAFIARGARFFLIAGLIRVWGPAIKVLIDKYFNKLVILFVLIVLFSCYLFL